MSISPSEAREVVVAGHHLRCQVCDFTRFHRREAQLAAGGSAFGQDWTNSKAECLVCEQCGYVHWFVRPRSVGVNAEDTALAEEIEILRRRLEAEYEDELEEARR
jgi:hypothetical protein